jgi:hypothetical protein
MNKEKVDIGRSRMNKKRDPTVQMVGKTERQQTTRRKGKCTLYIYYSIAERRQGSPNMQKVSLPCADKDKDYRC